MSNIISSKTTAAATDAASAGDEERLPNGPPMAAVLAAGIGTFVLGLFTVLAEASTSIKDWLVFREPVGPLSGKTTLAVLAWAVSWGVLAAAWRGKDVRFERILTVTFVLLGLGLLGTFPTFFERFAP